MTVLDPRPLDLRLPSAAIRIDGRLGIEHCPSGNRLRCPELAIAPLQRAHVVVALHPVPDSLAPSHF